MLNGNPAHVRNCSKVSDAVLLNTDILDIEEYQNKKGFDSLMHQVKLFRMWGDCYGYLLVATGFADIMMDPIMNPWDFLALIPILKGAGGTITDYHGNDPLKGNSIVATGGSIHQTVIEIINQ
jgi:myo-inositol-1(or 4)-monophosphatase